MRLGCSGTHWGPFIEVAASRSQLSAAVSLIWPKYYRMRLNFRGTKPSRITNLLNIRGFHFRRCYERINMVDHLVLGKLRNQLISNKALSVFVLPIQYNGARGTVRRPFFYDFATLARNIRRLNCLQMMFRTTKTAKVSSLENLSTYSIPT